MVTAGHPSGNGCSLGEAVTIISRQAEEVGTINKLGIGVTSLKGFERGNSVPISNKGGPLSREPALKSAGFLAFVE